jgi:hypothetical protein
VPELVAAINSAHYDNEAAYNQYMGFVEQINRHFALQ